MKRIIGVVCLLLVILGTGTVLLAIAKDCVNPPDGRYPQAEKYDAVVVDAESYYLVEKKVSTRKAGYTAYGILDAQGTWIVELAQDNCISRAIAAVAVGDNRSSWSLAYLGEGLFCCSAHTVIVRNRTADGCGAEDPAQHACAVINPFTDSFFEVTGSLVSECRNGYLFSGEPYGTVCRFDPYGNRKEFGECGDRAAFGAPSCGLVCIGQKFYNVETGDVVIDLSQYDMGGADGETPLNGNGSLSFLESGICYFEYYTPEQIRYYAVIDSDGNFIGEPYTVQLTGQA